MRDDTLMPKKNQDAEPKDATPMQGERAPPPLSEEMIAKLQAAVEAARRKHMPRHDPATDILP
jgi:hypothetical protein